MNCLPYHQNYLIFAIYSIFIMQIIGVKLKKGKEISILRKHPWVFSGAIQSLPKSIRDGDVTSVYTYDGLYLGKGHFQSGASIAVRILTFEQQEIDQHFWNETILQAKTYRQNLHLPSSDTNAYRLIHGEGDGISGLIIDIYNDTAVMQCHTIGVHLAKKEICSALIQAFGSNISNIYVRCKDTLPLPYSESVENEYLLGSAQETQMQENGVKFQINFVEGQKTGFFLDQRHNRHHLASIAKDKKVLNCFCYTGGFSVYALKAGAALVDSADISQKAIDLLEENLLINNITKHHTSYCVNVMQFLADEKLTQYDIVVVDPPAFAKSIQKRHNAVQAYKRLNALALKKVKPGGFLFTFSCSQVVGNQLFYDTIVAAGIEAGIQARVVQSLSQGPDHPINLFHPEGHYLKGLLLYIEPN